MEDVPMSAEWKVPFGNGFWLSVIAAHLWKHQAQKAAEELATKGKRCEMLTVSEEHFSVGKDGTLTISVTVTDLEHNVTMTVQPDHWGYTKEDSPGG